MEDAFHLGGELLFTVRKDAPLRMTQAQVRQEVHVLRETVFSVLMNRMLRNGGRQSMTLAQPGG